MKMMLSSHFMSFSLPKMCQWASLEGCWNPSCFLLLFFLIMTIDCKLRSPSASVVGKVGWMMVTCWPPMCSPWTSQWHLFIPLRCLRKVWGVQLGGRGHGDGMPTHPKEPIALHASPQLPASVKSSATVLWQATGMLMASEPCFQGKRKERTLPEHLPLSKCQVPSTVGLPLLRIELPESAQDLPVCLELIFLHLLNLYLKKNTGRSILPLFCPVIP